MAKLTVYHSDNLDRVSDHIDDYNSSVYYENPSYLFESFMAGHILDT